MNPWSCVFRELVKDASYWAERVHHPAAAWIAAGSRSAPKVASEAEVLAHLPGMEAKFEAESGNSPGRKRIRAEKEELRAFREGGRHADNPPRGRAKAREESRKTSQVPLCVSRGPQAQELAESGGP